MEKSDRYYAFSPLLGRRRIPDHYARSQETAMTYAQTMGYDNLVQEFGPPSKPTGVREIWSRVKRTVPGPPPVQVAVAVMDTEHGRFVATGTTSQEALDRLADAWRTFAEAESADPVLAVEDISVTFADPIGTVYRNWQRMA